MSTTNDRATHEGAIAHIMVKPRATWTPAELTEVLAWIPLVAEERRRRRLAVDPALWCIAAGAHQLTSEGYDRAAYVAGCAVGEPAAIAEAERLLARVRDAHPLDHNSIAARAERTIAARRKAIGLAARSIGWEVVDVDIDVSRQTARVKAERGGRIVTLDLRGGKATVERWERAYRTERVGTRRRDSMLWDVRDDRFLGRMSCPEARAGLRAFVEYLVANGNGRALAHDLVAVLGLPAGEP